MPEDTGRRRTRRRSAAVSGGSRLDAPVIELKLSNRQPGDHQHNEPISAELRSPGDVSHSLMRAAVSARLALRRSRSRSSTWRGATGFIA